ncbi:MFS transporter [Marinobacterium jannaschii]|uniref:MFS transporter n=1 Tax=Marinobacterium jannaschii TaxID=64970 RepID=UPI00047F5F36|nr:MFS transporter [Marinobacterium jannaschii]
MGMAAIFGMNQIISHGFGVFLFAALVPLMREDIALTHWHLAAIGALSQLAYLGGAMLLGLIGHRIAASKLLIGTGTVTTSLLASIAFLSDPLVITAALTCLSASAAISWGAIVDVISRSSSSEKSSTYLSTAASGTAWGYGFNGLLILLVVPLLGWQSGWLIAAAIGVVVIIITLRMLGRLKRKQPGGEAEQADSALSAAQLLSTVIRQPVALTACLLCFFVGFTTMPFSNWLNTFLAELQLPSALGGLTWTTLGLTGMFAGFVTGKLADSKGHGVALLLIFTGFATGLGLFVLDPGRFALLAGVGYGMMYFPVWGILAGWVSRYFAPTATMQISGFCMVMAGLGGASGNLIAGFISDSTSSLVGVYQLLALVSLLPVAIALWILAGRSRISDQQQTAA